MNKKEVLLKIFGWILILWPFIYNDYNLIRIISVVIGVFLLTLKQALQKRKINLKVILLPIVLICMIYGIDFLLARFYSRVPIISYEVKSSSKISTYNSIFYRMYNCNGVKIFDQFYKKNYMCDTTLTEENVNSLLGNIANNFSKYQNKFVNVNGKISSIAGSTSISMQAYETGETSINGQVLFSDNITLVIMNNGNLEKVEDLKIYDTINVIGRIDKIKNNGQNKEIIMQDAKIISRSNFSEYEISINENKSCEVDLKLMSKTDTYNYYSYCLTGIYVKYNEDNIYDLSYVLTDKRMTFEMLTKDIEKETNEIGELYKYNDFNLLKCNNSNNVIIGNKELNLDTNYCDDFEVVEESSQDEGI